MPEWFSTNKNTHAKRRSLWNHLRTSLFHLKKWSGWYNHRLNEGKTKFKEIGRWFYGKSLQDVDENDIIARIGYFMSKKYNEEIKIEDVLDHLDGMLDKIQSIVVA